MIRQDYDPSAISMLINIAFTYAFKAVPGCNYVKAALTARHSSI